MTHPRPGQTWIPLRLITASAGTERMKQRDGRARGGLFRTQGEPCSRRAASSVEVASTKAYPSDLRLEGPSSLGRVAGRDRTSTGNP
eukprot:5378312-Amphidinium_carterae.1